MNTNLTTLVASLSFLFSAACSAPPSEATPESTTAASSVEAGDAGYVLTTLNSGATSHVVAVDLSVAGIDTPAISSALATPGTIAARGTVRDGGTFVASDLYRALPSETPAPPATTYLAHVSDHGADSATEVNEGKVHAFHVLDVSEAAARDVDQPWLSARVLDGAALVAGSITSGVLHASTVFVRLPDAVTCAKSIEACGEGTVPTYTRNANRCLVPSGCERREMCAMIVPTCDPGYTRSSWPGAHGCPAFACDPDFDPAP